MEDVSDGGFQSAEGKFVRVGEVGAGEFYRAGVTASCRLLDRRTAGIGQTHQAGAFVERFPGGVVAGPPEQAIIAVPAQVEQVRMPPGNDQGDGGEIGFGLRGFRPRRSEEIRVQVRLDVVDADQWHVQRHRHRFRGGDTDQECPEQSGAVGDGDQVDLARRDARLPECGADHRVDRLDVAARRDLRDHAAEPGVFRHLRRHHGGQNPPPVAHDRDGGFIARRFDTEYVHVMFPRSASASRSRSRCSTRVSMSVDVGRARIIRRYRVASTWFPMRA